MRAPTVLVVAALLAGCGGSAFEPEIQTAESAEAGAVQGQQEPAPEPDAGMAPDARADAPAASQEAAAPPPEASAPDAQTEPEAASCDPTTCASGCCSTDGVCVTPGTDQHACGQQGQACGDCGSGGSPWYLRCGTVYSWTAGEPTGVLGGHCCTEGATDCY